MIDNPVFDDAIWPSGMPMPLSYQNTCRVVAIGDVHGKHDLLWAALRSAGCATPDHMPTLPVLMGWYQVVLIGDVVHPKSFDEYERIVGAKFDHRNPVHLERAADWQIKALRELMRYQQAAPHAVHIVLGNHDDVLLDPKLVIGTGDGLRHIEFDTARGGKALPSDLVPWVGSFVREVRLAGVQFAHVGPMPAQAYYDDIFYGDKSNKNWFQTSPHWVRQAGLHWGVYGHTQMENGIYIWQDKGLALIDALGHRQYLEMFIQHNNDQNPVYSVRACVF